MKIFVGLAGFPAMLLCRKLGAGKIQALGGILACVGMVCTAFSVTAWQALLANGVLSGKSLQKLTHLLFIYRCQM